MRHSVEGREASHAVRRACYCAAQEGCSPRRQKPIRSSLGVLYAFVVPIISRSISSPTRYYTDEYWCSLLDLVDLVDFLAAEREWRPCLPVELATKR